MSYRYYTEWEGLPTCHIDITLSGRGLPTCHRDITLTSHIISSQVISAVLIYNALMVLFPMFPKFHGATRF